MSANSPPVLVLGGQENTLSLCRSLGKRGIEVYISVSQLSPVVSSRFCKRTYCYSAQVSPAGFWCTLLLKENHPELKGCVLLPCSDEAVEFMCRHRDALQAQYLVDDYDPGLHLAMLDKCQTLALAEKAGCPVPAFHHVRNMQQLAEMTGEIGYPIMIKPIHSHIFTRYFPQKKYFTAVNAAELRQRVQDLLGKGIDLIISEIIPGPDHLQSAYFSYVTSAGNRLFDYTHQIVRRYPCNSGLACLTVTRKLMETQAMGQRFFEATGYRGMGHIEFKRDPRDGKLKVIECNPRFSAAQEIAVKSGLDMAFIIYDYLVNGNEKYQPAYREEVKRWWVLRDIFSFLELRRSGDLSLAAWLRSIKTRRLAFPYFSLTDPKPFLQRLGSDLAHFFKNRLIPKWIVKKESLQRR